MKVAFLGNMNNNHFAMARFLRDRGVDASVLQFDYEHDHFRPEADSYDLSFMDYCYEVPWNTDNFLATSKEAIKDCLRPYDILIGCGPAPAYCQKAGRNLDIFVPYGGDIWTLTFYKMISPHRIPNQWMLTYYQRKGIQNSTIFHMHSANTLYETQYQKYQGRSERWDCGVPFVYTGIYHPQKVLQFADKTHWFHEFQRIREKSDLMIFSHIRHVWGGEKTDPNQKGNDKLIKGFSLFLQKNQQVKANLILFNYGNDAGKSKQLIDDLGIRDHVFWMPKMYRKDLMVGLVLSDIFCNQFQNGWLGSGAINESLAMGKPLLGFRDDEMFKYQDGELYPMMNAKSPESICAHFEEYMANPEKYKEMGREGHRWYEKYIVEAALEKYMNYIESKERESHSSIHA